MICDAVSSSTIFFSNIISKQSGSYRLSFSGSGSSTIRDPIVRLPNGEYRVLQPIPVVFEKTEDGWIAWFEHAGIGMPGATITEARDLLSHNLLDAFVFFTENEDKLGPGPIVQLEVLRSYITRQE